MSREFYKAYIRTRISGVQNQVFGAIIQKTWGAVPPVKEAQISNADIRKATGLESVAVSKALSELIERNFITKFGNYAPPKYCIQKDYEKWQALPKKVRCSNGEGLRKSTKKPLPNLVTDITKIGKSQETLPIIKKLEKEKIDSVYDFYKTEIRPNRKSSARAKKNIARYLKEYPAEQLKKSILNYKTTIDFSGDPKFRKDPANFFGANDPYFIDYLPENFAQADDCDDAPGYKCKTMADIMRENCAN